MKKEPKWLFTAKSDHTEIEERVFSESRLNRLCRLAHHAQDRHLDKVFNERVLNPGSEVSKSRMIVSIQPL